ncbi:MAG: tRNA (N(6)-L-threonylcarbamoyladenosine(37)-C(2))-methylthiotransferase MtaB [Bacilli bacterium]|nr:tRNA (N(6)-L-threonylcarbamoyladenosine(37)-C(2))-methylthiotransferase MtaB [Bacilli bacterium]
MKVSYYSLGCKVNLYESEAIINEFIDHGFELASFDDICDIYIINTCSITAVSDAKSRKVIRQAVKRNPDAIIAVMGCYAQLNPEKIEEIPGVSIILGTNKRHLLFSLVMEQFESRYPKRIIDPISKVKEYEEIKIKRYNNKTRGFVKIQDGCNNFCSYCTIPYARGPVRSRNKDEILSEIQLLTDEGMREIILTGINTASYGQDLVHIDFADLLEDIFLNTKNLGRVRISSIEITEINDKLLAVLKRYQDHFCLHLHVPLQGGTDKTLKNMYRKYTIEEYRQKIKQIRTIFHFINITTDILAGFAMETESDFLEGYRFIGEMNFGEMHVFPYSKRPLTAAYQFTDHINNEEKTKRVHQLLELNKIKAVQYRKLWVGKTVEVLVEKVVDNIAYGHTSNYLQVTFQGAVQTNDLVKVTLINDTYPISKGVIQ